MSLARFVTDSSELVTDLIVSAGRRASEAWMCEEAHLLDVGFPRERGVPTMVLLPPTQLIEEASDRGPRGDPRAQ